VSSATADKQSLRNWSIDGSSLIWLHRRADVDSVITPFRVEVWNERNIIADDKFARSLPAMVQTLAGVRANDVAECVLTIRDPANGTIYLGTIDGAEAAMFGLEHFDCNTSARRSAARLPGSSSK
jgi:hypothetical protein